MPDLSEQAVLDWSRGVPGLEGHHGALLRPAEHAGGIATRIEELGALLDQVASQQPTALSNALRHAPLDSALRSVLAQLGPARLLRVLHWLSEADLPESHAVAQHLTSAADPAATTIRNLIEAAARRSTMQAALHPQRLNAVQQALEETER